MIELDNPELKEIRARNEQRVKEAIEKMGEKWLLHPKNKVKRLRKKSVLKNKG